jgi:hypothetical protein
MNSKWLSTLFVSLLMLLCAFTAFGQSDKTSTASQYVISAKAGGVNFVEGKVTVTRRAGTSGVVVEGDEIQIGDRVTTGDDGMAEILLNPGSYLRLGHDSSFEFGSTDLENLKLNLRSGSAVVELYATDEFKVTVKLPQSELQFTRSGVFRIDVQSDGTAKLMVFKGKAYVGQGGSTEVESGRMAAIVKGGVSVSKFSKNSADALDIWSKSRSKELASLNGKLQRDSLRNSLLGSFNNRGWNLYNSFGLWVFDPGSRRWLFLPFGYGWSSPYGWDYGWDLWRCRMPWYVWNPTYYPPTPPVTGGGGNPPISAANEARRQRMHTPPFQRAEQSTARSDDGNSRGIPNSFPPSPRGGDSSSGGESRGGESRGAGRPTFNPPPVSAPPMMLPPVETKPPVELPKGKPGV